MRISDWSSDVCSSDLLQYIWDDNLNFYTSYARGYKSGGYNSLSYTGEDLPFKPEKAATVEVGFTSRFFHRTLNFNTPLYRITPDNLTVIALDRPADTCLHSSHQCASCIPSSHCK